MTQECNEEGGSKLLLESGLLWGRLQLHSGLRVWPPALWGWRECLICESRRYQELICQSYRLKNSANAPLSKTRWAIKYAYSYTLAKYLVTCMKCLPLLQSFTAAYTSAFSKTLHVAAGQDEVGARRWVWHLLEVCSGP